MADTTTESTTINSGQAAQATTPKRGEVAIDSGATASVLKEQSVEERMESAKSEALTNHAIEHAGDDEPYEEVIERDAPSK